MKKQFLILSVVAGLTLAQTLLAQQPAPSIAQPLASTADAALTQKISCHGITSVPMTADQAQTLPLQIAATLACNDQVTVLSDFDGYTVNVRTADGKTGYVARMYLAPVTDAKQPVRQIASATVQNGVAHWQSGAPGCEQIFSDDGLTESVTVNGVTVQVSLQDTGWKYRALVAVANNSANHIYVTPSRLTLDVIAPAFKSLAWVDPSVLAKSASHQVLWTSAAANSAPVATTASYKVPFVAQSSPNYFGEAQASEPNASSVDTGFNTAQQVRGLALREGAVYAKERVTGAVWFEREKKARQLLLRVPVADVVYEFPLSFKGKK